MPDEQELQRSWNRAAEGYASNWEGQAAQLVAVTLDTAGVGPGSRVLDVGTGPGFLAAAAAERGAEATGTDFAEQMIDAARLAHPGIRFEQASAESQPFEDESFDAVVMGLTLFLLPDPRAALREANRLLADDGRFAASLWRFPLVGHALFLDRLSRYVKQEVVPDRLPLMGVSDHDVLCEFLSSAGFTDPRVSEMVVLWEIETARRLFDAMAAMVDLSSLSEAALTEFRDGVAADAEVYRDGEVLRVPFPAVVLSGVRGDRQGQ